MPEAGIADRLILTTKLMKTVKSHLDPMGKDIMIDYLCLPWSREGKATA